MYRIFCESYKNYIDTFDSDNYRLKVAEPFELIVDVNKFEKEKKQKSILYKKLCDLIYFMNQNIDKYPRFKAFLWTLASRDIEGKQYNLESQEDLEEQSKLINSFLKLTYWY